ncbi:MAG: DUF1127 domain-containing protein [Proteobacteria bacterium]|nr:DUF1127 domain-containing protein [Pseudomonadota bacterium]
MTTFAARFNDLTRAWIFYRRRRATEKAIAHLDSHLLKDIGVGHGELYPRNR